MPKRPPADPNDAARDLVQAATGTMDQPVALPAHITVKAGDVRCVYCGKTFRFTKREGERAAELRAFASIHAHD